MNILLYSWPFYPTIGGLQRMTELTATYLAGDSHSVTVVTATTDPAGRTPILPFRVERRPALPRLARLVRWADVVQLNTYHAAIFALARLWRRPVVWQHIDYDTISPRGVCFAGGRSCQGSFGECYRCLRRDHTRAESARALASLVLRRRSVYMMAANAVSTRHAQERMQLPRPVQIPFGIDNSRFVSKDRLPPPPLRVLFHGRHIPAKGCDVLVRAVRECRERGVPLDVRIAGDGPHRPVSEALAQQLGIAGEIAFLGFLSEEDLLAELQAAHVVVVPPIQDEAGALTACEGMSCGCAVVASAIGALPECLGNAGLLFPPGDGRALAERLARLAVDPALMADLVDRGQRHISAEYDWKVMGRRYVELYERISVRARPARPR